MAHVTHVEQIHVPGKPPLEITSIVEIHNQGVVQTLMALGYTKIGGVWVGRDQIQVFDNEARQYAEKRLPKPKPDTDIEDVLYAAPPRLK